MRREGSVWVLRDGFPAGDAMADWGPADPESRVVRWSLGDSWAVMRAELAAMEPTTLLFLDTTCGAAGQRALMHLAGRMQRAPGLTPPSTALESMTGISAPVSTASQWRVAPLLPSWCCGVHAGALLTDERWETLEFALLSATARLAAAGTPPMITGRSGMELDLARWMRAQLDAQGAALSRDYARWRDEGMTGLVPAQLQVEVIGASIEVEAEALDGGGPFFSLLCPAYKAAYFEEMLASVLGQRYGAFELLVLIDGPPRGDADYLAGTLAATGDARVRWEVQANAGTAKTRQRLAAMARGDFLLFVDDDDRLLPETLETFAAAAAAHPEAGVLRAGARLFGVVDAVLPARPRYLLGGLSADLFEVNQPFAVAREVLEAIGGFEGDAAFGGVGEDTDLFLRLDRIRARTVLIDAPLYERRLSALNQSLVFDGSGFGAHIRTLAGRHSQTPWVLEEVSLEESGMWAMQTLRYRNAQTGAAVVCPTRLVNFHTLGGQSAPRVWLRASGRVPMGPFVEVREVASDAEAIALLTPLFAAPPGVEQGDLCAVVEGVDYIAEDRLLLCPYDSPAARRFAPASAQPLHESYLNKVSRYRRGEFRDFCRGCRYCPRAWRAE